MNARVLEGECLFVMPTMDAESIDSVVTDPPYGLKFMGKEWDHGVPGSPFWIEALRVAKPGAHLVAFGGTRTHHRLACAIEDAGWELRDCLMWLYGSGFPKSLDVSKALDKMDGHWRDRANGVLSENPALSGPNYVRTDKGAAITPDGRKWEGWGTALKPAWEPIILARKPFRETVAVNVREHGTGALNVDACRIEAPPGESRIDYAATTSDSALLQLPGRWPANVVLDDESAALLDEQSGSSESKPFQSVSGIAPHSGFAGGLDSYTGRGFSDSGGASRFFYTAKASRSEREAGLNDSPRKKGGSNAKGYTDDVARGLDRNRPVGNHHPTVKPLALMQWLCRLVTPCGGVILDPFCGSGSTGRAAIAEGFSFIGIDKDAEYAAIARARIAEYAPLFGDVA